MTRSKWTNRVWAIGCVLFIAVLTGVWLGHGDGDIAMVAALMSMLPISLVTLYVKLNEDRKTFLAWMTENSFAGRSHYCLNCWLPLPDLDAKQCPHCSEHVHSFTTDLPGTQLATADGKDVASVMPAVELPSKRIRERISNFLNNKEAPQSLVWGCFAEILGYGAGFGLLGAVGIIYLGAWELWWLLIFEAILIALFIWVANKVGSYMPHFVKAEVKKHCPDGIAPWCIYCDYDLRGNIESTCPECGKPIFVYDFQWRPWKKKRSRPER